MLLEVFTTIALLCQINSASDPRIVELRQAQCQSWFINCLQQEANMEVCTEKRISDLLIPKK